MESGFQWPGCVNHAQHSYHVECIARYSPLEQALAHRYITGSSERILETICPVCRVPWGEQGAEHVDGLVQAMEQEGVEMPREGCACVVCRAAGAGPSDSQENPYGPLPQEADAPIAHARACCQRHGVMTWRTNRRARQSQNPGPVREFGWQCFWECEARWYTGNTVAGIREVDACELTVPAETVPRPVHPTQRCLWCREAATWQATHMTSGQLDVGWTCDTCGRQPPDQGLRW